MKRFSQVILAVALCLFVAGNLPLSAGGSAVGAPPVGMIPQYAATLKRVA